MKKVMFLMAVAGMFSFAACNNNAEEPATDTMPAEEITEPAPEPAAVDTTAPVDGAATEAPAAL